VIQGPSATVEGPMPAAAEAVRQAISTSARPVSIAFLDVVGVGLVNHRLGRPAGDELLRKFEDRLTASTEASEGAWRLGGDEFLLLMPDRSARSARRRVRRLQRTLADAGLHFRAGGATGPAGPATGTAWDLYVAAGQAMRQAKRHDASVVWAPLGGAQADLRNAGPRRVTR
jgi:diguanylate cyclase (GGDEF)-like protein